MVVVFFDDMKGSTVLKERMAVTSDEQAFQLLRKEHDALVTEVVTRDGGGEILKSTGDGLLAILHKPSIAVQRALEIQDRLHEHPFIRVRIGMDIGEVHLEGEDGRYTDAFGRHVDWAARAMDMAEAGHICVTRAVATDAVSWIGKRQVAWKEHGLHRMKPGEPPLDIYEPYNANLTKALESLRGERLPDPAAPPPPRAALKEETRIARSWEAVARDGRDFAQSGTGMMYWFKVPLGGLSYPEGFRNFLLPALENERIGKIRFMLDSSNPKIPDVWAHIVLPQLEEWARAGEVRYDLRVGDDDGTMTFGADGAQRRLGWVFGDLSTEYTPCFKMFVPDPDTDEDTDARAQIFLATALRTVRFKDGTLHQVRIPDAVLRVEPEGNASLLQALNVVANQWDPLFV